jgi:hypothetical protein
MSPSSPGPRVRLADAPDEGRTTATLVASLAARLGTLHVISGSTAVASLVQGFAALGREVSRSAEGARLRRALESGRAGMNGDALWTALRLGDWTAGVPPSPVLDQLRNDLALLLAGDLAETLALLPIPGQPAGAAGGDDGEPATFLDCALGLWAFSSELVRGVEALATPTLPAAGEVVTPPAPEPGPAPAGPLLR